MTTSNGFTRRATFKLAAGLATLPIVGAPGLAQAAVKRGGRLVYGRYADSLQLDPIWTDANVDIWVMSSIYDTLLYPTNDGLGVQEGLAKKWSVSEDGKTVVLSIRDGLKFSNGTPLQMSDIKWSLDRAANPKIGQWSDLLSSIDSVAITGPLEVTLKLKHPDPSILAALATFNSAIMPQGPFEAAKGATDEEKAKVFAETPLGTGPFMLAEWQRGVRMLFKRNPHYWVNGEDGKPLPYMDEIEFQIIPDDSTRILKLKAGELDGSEFIPLTRVKELKADPNLDMQLWPSTKVVYMTMNLREKLTDGSANPLSNVKVRQALNHAINKDAAIAVVTQGLGTPMKSYMSVTTPLVHKQDLYKYDVAKAKALLAEAGFPNGFETSTMIVSGNADQTNLITLVQQMWGAVGVKLKIEQLDNPTLTKRYRAGDFTSRASAWTNDIADPNEITTYFAYYPTIQNQHSGWQDKRIDELFEMSQKETDLAKRTAQYKEIQERYAAAAPIIFLYEVPYPVAFRKNVKGFLQIPLGNNFFERVNKV